MATSFKNSFGMSETDNKGPGRLNPSRLHLMSTYLEVKYLASGDNGDTFAAIHKMDASAIMGKYSDHSASAECLDELRSKVVAIKIARQDAEEGDSKNEINFLTKTLKRESPCYTHCIDSFVQKDIQWLALPLISGGNLGDFAFQFPHAITVAFRAHVAQQLARAVLFITSGSTNERQLCPTPGWPRITHGDIFVGNILLRPPHAAGFADFPDLVLADFGRADTYLATKKGDEDFRVDMASDVRMITEVVDDVGFKTGGREACGCKICKLGERRLNSALDVALCPRTKKAVKSSLQALQDLALTAQHERVTCYHRMPSDALQALKAHPVSNAELTHAITGWSR